MVEDSKSQLPLNNSHAHKIILPKLYTQGFVWLRLICEYFKSNIVWIIDVCNATSSAENDAAKLINNSRHYFCIKYSGWLDNSAITEVHIAIYTLYIQSKV